MLLHLRLLVQLVVVVLPAGLVATVLFAVVAQAVVAMCVAGVVLVSLAGFAALLVLLMA